MMDDGMQYGFGFRPQSNSLLRRDEIVVDLFAGGGGASEALRQAIGREPDICINHDPAAIGMHAANHPHALHLCEDVWHADPRTECAGNPIGWLHASPDCTHFSQAKGGQPRSRATRSLSWVILRWAGSVRPRIISLENVKEILQWGPLVAKRDKSTGLPLRSDGSVAAVGECVPIRQQYLIPDKRHAGRTWRAFVAALRRLGYAVEWRKLRACDYGAGTSRERLFMIARRDGEAIRWPEPTHGPGRPRPYVTAGDCIDWSIPCQSIFTRKKPLAEATLRRIARGIKRYVVDAEAPFFAPNCAAFLTEFANASRGATWSADEPLRTQCAKVKGGHFALVTAFIEQANGGGPNGNPAPSRSADMPLSTIMQSGSQQRLVTARLSEPGDIRALRVAAVLLQDPLDTITTRDRMALVTVIIAGTPYVIVDIGLRMLTPRELYTAQGFPRDYVIDRTASGRILTCAQRVRMVGNSVSPPPLAAIARANMRLASSLPNQDLAA